jgi:amino acid permease
LLVAAAIVAYVTMFWLIKGAFRTGKDDYAHLVNDLLGHGAGVFLHIIFILLTFCVGTLYFIVSSNFMPQIL